MGIPPKLIEHWMSAETGEEFEEAAIATSEIVMTDSSALGRSVYIGKNADGIDSYVSMTHCQRLLEVLSERALERDDLWEAMFGASLSDFGRDQLYARIALRAAELDEPEVVRVALEGLQDMHDEYAADKPTSIFTDRKARVEEQIAELAA